MRRFGAVLRSVIINSQLSTFFLVAAATWFESLAVAWRPLQGQPRRNNLYFTTKNTKLTEIF